MALSLLQVESIRRCAPESAFALVVVGSHLGKAGRSVRVVPTTVSEEPEEVPEKNGISDPLAEATAPTKRSGRPAALQEASDDEEEQQPDESKIVLALSPETRSAMTSVKLPCKLDSGANCSLLQLGSAELLARARLVHGTSTDFIDHPEEGLAVAYILLVAVIFLRSSYNSRVNAKKESVLEAARQLQRSIDDLASEGEDIVANTMESSALLAERNFETKRRHFLKFLKSLMNHNNDDEDADSVDAFRMFISYWLHVFQECSIDPVHEPVATLTEEDLLTCSTCWQIASVVYRDVEQHHVQFIADEVDKLTESKKRQQLDDSASTSSASKSTWRMLKRSWLPVTGCFIGAFSVYRDDITWACITIAAAVFSLYVICYASEYNELAKLEERVEELKVIKEKTKLEHDRIVALFSQLESVTNLWLHRTLPQLDLLHEVSEELRAIDTRGEHKRCPFTKLLKRLNPLFEEIVESLGPRSIWSGQSWLNEKQLMVVAGVARGQTGVAVGKKTRGNDLQWFFIADGQALAGTSKKELARKSGKLAPAPDRAVNPACQKCGAKFWALNHRHHCRRCSEAFCRICCSNKIPLPKMGYNAPVKVCDNCIRIEKELAEAEREIQSAKQGDSIPAALENACRKSFLQIRHMVAKNLDAPDSGGMNDLQSIAYRLHVIVDEFKWLKTEPIKSDANPSWEEEYFIPVKLETCEVRFEVISRRQGGNDRSVGFLILNFRDAEPDVWHKIYRPLVASSRSDIGLEFRCFPETSCLALECEEDEH
eukprot:TRINITY_DN2605_c0_g1_i1.p1 TRINITY_DN2605_c0_g1~~TRINITY_DN2605_c0_g1_i1.p1  ORF type:complete len:811 (+),score=111.17 TRINITY_DN2605_c0_g1_i1:121-2433(+)